MKKTIGIVIAAILGLAVITAGVMKAKIQKRLPVHMYQ